MEISNILFHQLYFKNLSKTITTIDELPHDNKNLNTDVKLVIKDKE